MLCSTMSFQRVLITLVLFGISVEAFGTGASMNFACTTTRQLTNSMEQTAYTFWETTRASATIDPNFDGAVFSDVSLAFAILSDDITSPASWDILNSFLDVVQRNEALIGRSLLGVSVVYMIDEICLRREIQDSVRKYEELWQRFEDLHRKWLYENRLLEDLSTRLERDPLENKNEDVKRLDKIKTFVYEVKALLHDIHDEISNVRQQHEKSHAHAAVSVGFGAIGAAMAYFADEHEFLHRAGKAAMYGGGVGAIYSWGNVAVSGKLLEALEDLENKAEKLYGEIDRVHAQVQRAFRT